MTRRRAIIGLSMLGGSIGQLVTLYQTGIVSHLPDPPGQKLFDADRVDASNYAYNKFNSGTLGTSARCRCGTQPMNSDQKLKT